MKKIPKEFFIKGNLWKVKQVFTLKHGNKRVEGLADPIARILYVDRGLKQEAKFIAFKHEWRHAVLHEYECGYDSGFISMKQEEKIQDALDTEEASMFQMECK